MNIVATRERERNKNSYSIFYSSQLLLSLFTVQEDSGKKDL